MGGLLFGIGTVRNQGQDSITMLNVLRLDGSLAAAGRIVVERASRAHPRIWFKDVQTLLGTLISTCPSLSWSVVGIEGKEIRHGF